MPNIGRQISLSTLLAVLLAAMLAGCSGIGRTYRIRTPQDAFIQYWGAPAGTGRIRLAVKDLIDMKGVVSTAGSEYILNHNIPAKRDAACLKQARREHVIFVGKTNLSELAVAPSGLNRFFRTPINPLNKKVRLIPGGSSSGSAVAVADNLADVSFGTDTAGSVRVPAACCGVVGLKTTYGLVSLKGIFPIEPVHLDTVGPMGKDIAHTVTGMELLEPGFRDKYRDAIAEHPSGNGITVGRLYVNGTDPKIDAAVDESLRRAKFKVVRLSDGFKSEWIQAQRDGTNVAAGGAWLNDHFWADKPGITARTKAVLALGSITYNADYKAALARRNAWQRDLRGVLWRVDLIALPTLNGLPPKVPPFLGSPLFERRILGLQNTVAVNFAGNPAVAVPIPVKDKVVPLTSLELIGRPLDEAGLLNAGRLIEASQKYSNSRAE